ncbi:MAG: cytidine deaminase [bacterium]|nr:cytidine deaminase [bacterium]
MQRLMRAAKEAMEMSYSPYSEFRVGAAVLTKTGRVITGANVENAASGEGICAERSALLRANAQGAGRECIAIAVVARKDDEPTKTVTPPCGACRQVMQEFAVRSGVGGSFEIVVATTNFEIVEVFTLEELLPRSFGPEDLSST